MSGTSPQAKFWCYVSDCARLLYWIYFKPFTLNRYLKDIHANITATDNPFELKYQFFENHRLHQYALQSWWLTLIVPWLTGLVAASIISIITGEFSNFLTVNLFLIGWSSGLLLVRFRGNLKLWIYGLIISLSISGWIWSSTRQMFPIFTESIQTLLNPLSTYLSTLGSLFVVSISITLSVITPDMGFGMVLCTATGVAFSIAFSATEKVTFSVSLGVSFGVMSSVAFRMNGSRNTLRHVVDAMMAVTSITVAGVMAGTAMGIVVDTEAIFLSFGVAWIFSALRVYFWVPELLWTLKLFFLTPKRNYFSTLRHLPIWFDELIILPLPFMDTLIAEAYPQNPDLAQQTITHLINSTNQQEIATKAIANIALDLLNKCWTETQIAAVAEQLDWIPDPPPKQLGSTLPQLLDISRDVSAAVDATSDERHAEQLTKPIRALNRLSKELAFERQPGATITTGYIVKSWLSTLEAAQQLRSKTTPTIPQAYIAGPSLEPPEETPEEIGKDRFKGREDLMHEIERLALADQPPVLLLCGGRRTGKTSLLKYLPQRVNSELIPLLIHIPGVSSAKTLSEFVRSFTKQFVEAARRSRRNLRITTQPDPYLLEREPIQALQQWMEEIERAIPNRRFILCLDEFERLEKVIANTGDDLLDFLRYIMQARHRWILLFSGYHRLDELEPYWSATLNNTELVPISYLDPEAARELIQHPIANFPDIYEPTAINHILELTHRQPYLIQMLCSKLVDLLNREQRLCATVVDVDRVVEKTLEAASPYFSELWKSTLTAPERRLLKRLLQDELPQEDDRATVRKLVRREILHADSYQFQVPLVQQYIAQQDLPEGE